MKFPYILSLEYILSIGKHAQVTFTCGVKTPLAKTEAFNNITVSKRLRQARDDGLSYANQISIDNNSMSTEQPDWSIYTGKWAMGRSLLFWKRMKWTDSTYSGHRQRRGSKELEVSLDKLGDIAATNRENIGGVLALPPPHHHISQFLW